jgi:methanogenic corrinoid protein MtbC1
VAAWLQYVRVWDGETLDAAMRTEWGSRGALGFLDDCIAPFVREIGHGWARGDLAVSHEHYATERVRDFLADRWRTHGRDATGRLLMLTTLPGERHALGLHMAAVVCTLAGCRVAFIGPDTPLDAIRAGAEETGCEAVLVSVSAAADHDRVTRQLTALHALLPDSVGLVVGGDGAPPDFKLATRVSSLRALDLWCRRSFDASSS